MGHEADLDNIEALPLLKAAYDRGLNTVSGARGSSGVDMAY